MTILLVDDEYYLVQGVKSLIEQNSFGIDTILTAYSAQQARELYETQDIDILLADVEMPKEDGLSLVRWVRENGFESVNILLTGHESFQYARTAIELGVLEYLVKPATSESLSAVLSRAVTGIRRRGEEELIRQQTNMALFWRSLYNGSLSPDPDSRLRNTSAASPPSSRNRALQPMNSRRVTVRSCFVIRRPPSAVSCRCRKDAPCRRRVPGNN